MTSGALGSHSRPHNAGWFPLGLIRAAASYVDQKNAGCGLRCSEPDVNGRGSHGFGQLCVIAGRISSR